MTQIAPTAFRQGQYPALQHSVQRQAGAPKLGFVLFMLINATLFVRPAELFWSLNGWPIYEVLCELCVLVSLPQVVEELSPRTLKRWPMSACVAGLLAAVVLSRLSHFQFAETLGCTIEFAKLLIYFTLFMVHVNSVERLKQFLMGTAAFTLGITCLALLQYHNFINLPQFAAYHERQDDMIDDETGEGIVLARLCGLGIFDNPNDLARILVVVLFICLAFLGDKRKGIARFGWVIPIGILGYATALTYSRGGFLGLLGGLVVLFYVRYGRLKTVLAASVVLPALFLVFAGRQTDISVEDGTGHQRILLWRDGFAELVHSPVFGTGMNTYGDIAGLVAHNSFVHAFVELGVFGGTFFVGLCYFGIVTLYQSKRFDAYVNDPELLRLRPFVIAILVSYAVGMLSSARTYEVPTYTIAGIAAVYYRLLGRKLGEFLPSFTFATIKRLAVVSLLVLAGHYVFVRLAA